EALAELAHVQRVHAAILDPRREQPSDRAETGTARQRHAEASTHPVDVLLIVDRYNAPRTADLREEAVEAVERADVKHAAPGKAIRAEHRQAIAMVACDPGRVDPGRKCEGVKPKRNRIADALGVRRRRADGLHVGDDPLCSGRLRDRLDRVGRACMGCQSLSSSLFTGRSHRYHSTAPATGDAVTATTPAQEG